MTLQNNVIYKTAYNIVRKNKTLNHLAHRVIQSEAVNSFSPYIFIYKKLIQQKAVEYLKIPSTIEFEITNKCNARCIMCPPAVHMGQDFLDTDLFKKISKDAFSMGVRKMCLTGGEPLLDKQIFEKIKWAKKYGYDYIHLFSNGSLMGKSNQQKLLKSGIDSLTISVDSAVKEEYEAIRKNLNYDTVISNIKSLFFLKQKFKFQKPIIRINMVAQPANIKSRKIFIDMFKTFADIVEIIDDHNFAGLRDDTGRHKEYSQKTRFPCQILFCKIVVDTHGYLKKCGIDYTDSSILADLKRKNLKEALYKSRALEIKKKHLLYDFSEQGCVSCTQKESWWVDE